MASALCLTAVGAQLPADPLWLQIPAAENSPESDTSSPSAIWIRRVVNLDPTADSSVLLRVAGQGVVSVYFNGQRLLKNESLNSAAGQPAQVALDVTALLRRGSNGIAVTLSGNGGQQTEQVAVWLVDSAGKVLVASDREWKTTVDAPPVGWQQTDFNDRDWTPAAASAAVTDFQTLVTAEPQTRSWQPAETRQTSVQDPFELQAGDHVVMLGATFIERAQRFGHLEAMLTTLAHGQPVTFRNLGWSGDTVFAESRGIFDSAEQGYLRMIEHVRAEEPTVILLCYGQNEALQWSTEPDARQRFETQLNKLLQDLSTTSAECVLVSPHAFLPTVAPLPDPTNWNPVLQQYTDWLRLFASERQLRFVDLFTDLHSRLLQVDAMLVPDRTVPEFRADEQPELTAVQTSLWADNGMHFNEAGYERMALVLFSELSGQPVNGCQLTVDFDNQAVTATGAQVRQAVWSPADKTSTLVSFDVRRDYLSPWPTVVRIPSFSRDEAGRHSVQVAGPVDEAVSLRAFAAIAPAQGGYLPESALYFGSDPQYEQLRSLIVSKNELYFHRWRPQNITYLFGFRKHEQGNNASEIARFDPLIDDLEARIQQAAVPVWQRVTISRTDSTP